MRRTLLLGLVVALLAACASTPPVSPARRAEIHAAANACLPQHPTVSRYDVDAFGKITAWYEDEHTGPTAPPLPFFQCVRARLGHPSPSAAPAVTGGSTSGTPPRPSSSPPTRTADRLKELDALRQQRLISEDEYQAARKRILEGL